jgi:glucans biosynthesis protein
MRVRPCAHLLSYIDKSPAVTGLKVCRMHGAGGGAPRGNRNAWKHGLYSAETLALNRMVRDLARSARQLCGSI